MRLLARLWSFVRALFAQHDLPGTGSGGAFFDRTPRWTDRLASITVVRLIVWVAVAAWVHQGFYSDPYKLAEWMDDHQFYAWEEADRMTLLRWHELPAWNPYWCGGTVGVAAPEDPFLGPDFLLRLAFGVANGRRLAILLLVVLGFEGMYRLCRRLDATVVAAGFAAVVYGTCDRFVGFIHDGWINFLGFELVPWVILCFLKGLESWRWRLLGGFFFAWIVLSAGTYTTPFTLLALAYVTVAFTARGFFAPSARVPEARRPWLTPVVTTATIGLVALALAFGKLLPTLAFLRQFPRVFAPVEQHSAMEMFGVFWPKYGVVAVLGFVGLVTLDGAAAVFFGGLVFFVAMAMGDFGDWSPFHLLKSMPIFSQLRFPDRYMVIVLFFAAICSARGITRIEDAVPAFFERVWNAFRAWRKKEARPLPREITWAAIAIATYGAYTVVRPQAEAILELVRVRPGTMYVQEAPRAYDAGFKQHRGNRRDAHIFPVANMGSIYCVAGNPVPESALLRGDLEQEEYPVDPALATVKRLEWSPNRIVLEVDAKQPTTIRINQNWAPEWRTSVGTVKNDDKLLAVDVPAGKNVIALEYKDRALLACLTVSLLALLAFLFVMIREGVRFLRAESKAWGTMPTWPDELEDQEEQEEQEEEGEEEEDTKAEEPAPEAT